MRRVGFGETTCEIREVDPDRLTVRYRTPELTGDQWHEQGPYEAEEARSHLRDIAGYEGVTDAYLCVVFKDNQCT